MSISAWELVGTDFPTNLVPTINEHVDSITNGLLYLGKRELEISRLYVGHYNS